MPISCRTIDLTKAAQRSSHCRRMSNLQHISYFKKTVGRFSDSHKTLNFRENTNRPTEHKIQFIEKLKGQITRVCPFLFHYYKEVGGHLPLLIVPRTLLPLSKSSRK